MGKPTFENGERSDKEGWREADGILEGVSSLHSWIKNQTIIRPTTKMSHIRSMYDEVCLSHHIWYKHIVLVYNFIQNICIDT